MFKQLMRRTVITCAAVAAILFGASGNAQAADTHLILSDVDGHQVGSMVHLDPDPDRFKVCDTQADGSSVTGRVYRDNKLIGKITDGGDAGCDTKAIAIGSGTGYYMTLCWNGGRGDLCTIAWIVE